MPAKKISLIKHDPQLLEMIKKTDHKTLAIWAIDCFNRGLFMFNKDYPENEIIDKAISILKLWINDSISMWEARKYCWTVLKAARDIEIKDKVACQILRACSHTLATCHVQKHSEGSGMYINSAIYYFYINKEDVSKIIEEEKKWQSERLYALNQIIEKE